MGVLLSDLSAERQQLVTHMQQINYGRILHFLIRNGEPLFTPVTRIERSIRFGADNLARPDSDLEDFALKDKVVEMFTAFDQISEARILRLEIKGGLPFDMTVERREH